MVKNPSANAGDTREVGLIPGLGRSPGEGSGNLLQYSCLGNLMGRGTWWTKIHGVTKVGHDLATKPPPPDMLLKMLSTKDTEKNLEAI